MKLLHTSTAVSAAFDDNNLVSAAGLVPIIKLAEQAGLRTLAKKWLSVPTDNPGDSVIPSCSRIAHPCLVLGGYSSG